MKRHAALVPLSRDHHSALILAQLLKKDAPVYKGMPADTDGKIRYALSFFMDDLQQHFTREESLLKKIKHQSKEIETLLNEIFEEHAILKKLFLSLPAAADKPVAMDEAGRLLEAHIRKEERILFPLIQEHCGKELLEML